MTEATETDFYTHFIQQNAIFDFAINAFVLVQSHHEYLKERAANRTLTPEENAELNGLEAFVQDYTHLKTTDYHILTLKSGYTVIGFSSPARIEDYERHLGVRYAREDAVNHAAAVKGYEIKQERNGGPSPILDYLTSTIGGMGIRTPHVTLNLGATLKHIGVANLPEQLDRVDLAIVWAQNHFAVHGYHQYKGAEKFDHGRNRLNALSLAKANLLPFLVSHSYLA